MVPRILRIHHHLLRPRITNLGSSWWGKLLVKRIGSSMILMQVSPRNTSISCLVFIYFCVCWGAWFCCFWALEQLTSLWLSYFAAYELCFYDRLSANRLLGCIIVCYIFFCWVEIEFHIGLWNVENETFIEEIKK